MAITKLFGQITQIGNTETFGENGFQKRVLIIETVEQYPNHFSIDFTQKKCELLDNVKVGDNVAVSYNLQGRKYVNKEGEEVVFNSIIGWNIENLRTETPNSSIDQYQTTQSETEKDDLPY